MKKIGIIILATIFLIQCKSEQKSNLNLKKSESDTIKNTANKTPKSLSTKKTTTQATLPIKEEITYISEYPERTNFKKYSLNDTIKIDLNGNGELEKIYFVRNKCKYIFIEQKRGSTLKIGCNETKFIKYPELVDWIDEWGVISDKKTWEVLIKENGDLDKDTIIKLERPSIYVQKLDAGGGILTFKKGKLYWVHQSD
ncbi:hypothetical protein [Aquimarina sp. 2304DJ70-9]|uniref:hypothetical protein n=1 Tax=Aquimarina penaris TaxID=3231044 RepID=UPI0034618CED